MVWNNVYQNSNQSLPLVSHASVQGRLSVASNVSITGSVTVAGSITASSGVSGTFTPTSLSVGGGTALSFVTRGQQTVAIITAAATKSTETTWTNQLAAMGDIVVGSNISTSALSAGLAWNMYVSATSTIALRFSNVSTVAASTDTTQWRYWLFR